MSRRLTFEECWAIQGVTKCEDCSIYEKCCDNAEDLINQDADELENKQK